MTSGRPLPRGGLAGWRLGIAVAGLGATLLAAEAAVTVRIVAAGAGFRLERDGQPYFIKGAVGTTRLDLLAASGGNSVRTGPQTLDQAQALGLTCLVALPLGNPRQGFDYRDKAQVDAQYERVRGIVRRHRDHPALLMWNLGNEPEIETTPETRAPLWTEVNRLAELVKTEDPNHPVIAVVGDAYRRLLGELDRYCPALDAIGLNAYVDMLTLPEDLAKQGWRRPYVITEFGPRGHWQVPKTAWGAPTEDSSTEKAAFYLRAYRHAVEGQPRCLGSYAFYWAHKQEKTHTWYGLFLPDGSRTEAMDVLQFVWTGNWPTNRCPQIKGEGIQVVSARARSLRSGAVLEAGRPFQCRVKVSDPDGDPLTLEWDLRLDVADHPGVGGDPEPATPPIAGAIRPVEDGPGQVEVRLPPKPGKYRLFVYVRDGQGNAATANLPILAVMPGGGTTGGLSRP